MTMATCRRWRHDNRRTAGLAQHDTRFGPGFPRHRDRIGAIAIVDDGTGYRRPRHSADRNSVRPAGAELVAVLITRYDGNRSYPLPPGPGSFLV